MATPARRHPRAAVQSGVSVASVGCEGPDTAASGYQLSIMRHTPRVLALNALSVFLLFRLQINDGSRELGKGLIGCLFFFDGLLQQPDGPVQPMG